MDPSYIYFNEIDTDQDSTFTANLSKENEIEKVVFNKKWVWSEWIKYQCRFTRWENFKIR